MRPTRTPRRPAAPSPAAHQASVTARWRNPMNRLQEKKRKKKSVSKSYSNIKDGKLHLKKKRCADLSIRTFIKLSYDLWFDSSFIYMSYAYITPHFFPSCTSNLHEPPSNLCRCSSQYEDSIQQDTVLQDPRKEVKPEGKEFISWIQRKGLCLRLLQIKLIFKRLNNK